MKQYFFIPVRLTFICIVIFMGAYPLLIFGVAQVSPNKGNGETVIRNNKVVGYLLEGQRFTSDAYFNDRPSACNYDASASSGTNKGPSNPDYLKDVAAKTDSFLVHNPAVKRGNVPSELVTSSGSGLDPDISVAGALVQVPRIAGARKLASARLKELIEKDKQKPLLGIFGPEKINVLQLNLDLDALN
jgi:K+-transporting ATPase ATPase C chain